MREVVIAGGGLAGLALGIGLRKQDVPVTIHEAGTYPRHRVCGEFINGVSDSTLQRLGIGEALKDARRHRSTCWFVGDEAVYSAELPEAARGISRYVLDERLRRIFERCGGTLLVCSRLRKEPREGLVWAAGRRIERESNWIGLKVHARNFASEAELEMHVGEGGYAGTSRVEDDRVNICGLFQRRRGMGGRGVELLRSYLAASGLRQLSERLAAADSDEDSLTGVSGFRLGRQRAEDGLLAVGDAESMIPPFTGNGMSMAFEAAEGALNPLINYAQGALSWGEAIKATAGVLRRRFRRRLTAARVVHPFLLAGWGRWILASSARTGVLPFNPLFRILR